MNDEPLAFFITWTVYGTFLQGNVRGWHKRRKGFQSPRPRLVDWRAERLKHAVLLLDEKQRESMESEIERLSSYRGWQLWARSARSNHVHVVVGAPGYSGGKIRDQLKANCTRVLRECWPQFNDRPVWTEGGDWQCIDREDDLEQVVMYVTVAQDRKEND